MKFGEERNMCVMFVFTHLLGILFGNVPGRVPTTSSLRRRESGVQSESNKVNDNKTGELLAP